MDVSFILLVAALILAIFAAAGWPPSRVNLHAAAFACFIGSLLV